MELDIFMKVLESSLVKRGIPPEVASRHTAALRHTFNDDDLKDIQNIQSESEVDVIADGITSILGKNQASSTSKQHNGTQKTISVPVPIPVEEDHFYEHHNNTEKKAAQNSADFFEVPRNDDRSERGPMIFWGILLLTLPLSLGLLGIILGGFAAMYIALIIGIIAFIAALISVVACGAGISLIGIIYGITQLFSNVPAGIYEIGLGVTIIGFVALAGILLYNAAIRFLPWVMRWLTVFFTFVIGRLKYYFCLARRECYKL